MTSPAIGASVVAMLEATNMTPGQVFAFEKEGILGQVFSVIVLKSSFDLTPGLLRLSDDPLGIVLADAYFGAPETTSLRVEGDLVIQRPGTDLWITGEAVAPSETREREWLASIELGPSAQQFRFFGPRAWSHHAEHGWRLGAPEPTRSVALRYEHAFGGTGYPENPVGVGFHAKDELDTAKTYSAPSILSASDDYAHIEDRLDPAPLGPLSRWWQPRYRWAGTFDAAWERSWRDKPGGRPFLPQDFDYRFYNAAHPRFVVPGRLRGDEPLSIHGFGARVETTTRLPGWRFVAVLQDGDEAGRAEDMKLDTVHLDLQRRQAHLVWRLTLPADLGASRALCRFASEG
jgi:hypothetical protein